MNIIVFLYNKFSSKFPPTLIDKSAQIVLKWKGGLSFPPVRPISAQGAYWLNASAGYFSFGYHLENLGSYSKLIHEYIGLLACRLTGRTKNFWPNLKNLPINKTIL